MVDKIKNHVSKHFSLCLMLRYSCILVRISCSFCTWTLFSSSLHASQVKENNLYPSEEIIQPITSVKNLEINLEQSENSRFSLEKSDIYLPNHENYSLDLPGKSDQQITQVKILDNSTNKKNTNYSKHTIEFNKNDKKLIDFYPILNPVYFFNILETNPEISRYNRLEEILIAAPNNFNPGEKLSPPPVPKPPKPKPAVNSNPPIKPVLLLENIQTNFRDDYNKFNQHNHIIEPTFQFGLRNGQKISLKTGFNTFEQPKFDTVTNIPLQFGWQTKIEKFNIQTAGGIDVFNRLPIAFNFNLQVDRPIFIKLTPEYKLNSALFLAAVVEHGPYKSSAQTLEKSITSTRTGLNAYWQIKPDMSFFTLYRIGFYNDGNFEQQSFSRLEHKFGEFYVAGNLFAWTFNNDRQQAAGYFSPKNFLVYNVEAGWEKQIFDFLSCKLNANIGQQILNGNTTNGTTYQARCIAKVLPGVNLDFGYAFSSSRELDTGNSPYNNRNLSGQLQIKF